jgi:hypothetical protein
MSRLTEPQPSAALQDIVVSEKEFAFVRMSQESLSHNWQAPYFGSEGRGISKDNAMHFNHVGTGFSPYNIVLAAVTGLSGPKPGPTCKRDYIISYSFETLSGDPSAQSVDLSTQ